MRERQDQRERDTTPGAAGRDFIMERFGSLRDTDRSFDIEYWQRQGDAAIFQAAWELAEFYHRDQGMGPDELRLQRSVENFERSSAGVRGATRERHGSGFLA
jgi:hypothetical protein